MCFKMNPLSSELPFHVHNWLIISLEDFCIVIRKWPTFWPSTYDYVIVRIAKIDHKSWLEDAVSNFRIVILYS